MRASSRSPLTIEQALAVIGAEVSPLQAEHVPLAEAHGRFLAQDIAAGLDLPPFTNSAMDGYAVRAQDTPGRLQIVGESAAGVPYVGTLHAGEAIVISTGAAVPAGADSVVTLEQVTVEGTEVHVPDQIWPDASIRRAGSDVRRGDSVLRAGVRVGPAQIGAAAALGRDQLPCGRMPRVALLTTGTELRQPGQALGEGQIYDSNGPMLSAALHTAGAVAELIPAAADTPDSHREALARALEHDVVISSGGVSVGAHDLVRGVGRELGVRELFWRVAMRPGKPLAFGVRDRTLVFGLPGNPVSTLVCFVLFVRPALLGLQGAAAVGPDFSRASLATAVARNPERDDLIRVRIVDGALEPLPGQQSHQITATAQADALARIPAGTGVIPAGAEVSYLGLR
jgi:molybdopterin molybdotransferase